MDNKIIKILAVLKEIRETFFIVIANNLPRLNMFNKYRYKILRYSGVNIIGPCTIWSGFDIRPIGNASNLTIEKGVFVNRFFRCAVPGNSKVYIGEGTAIGPNVMIETAYHGVELKNRKETCTKSVRIGKNVWVGAGSIILAGVEISDNSIIAAGSVVTENVGSNILVAGVPAIFKKAINNGS